MIRLALTDLDNTLIPLGAGEASLRARGAIHALLDAGLHFGPVTGRVPAAMRWMFAGDEACGRTGAYVNGQIIYAVGRKVYEAAVDAELLNAVANLVNGIPGVALTVYDLDSLTELSDGKAYYLGATAEELAAHPEVFGTGWEVLERPAEPRYLKCNLRCAFGLDRAERMAKLQGLLRTEVPELEYVLPMAGGYFIDILPDGWSKGRAVEVLSQELGLSLDEVAAFGDSENDLAMLDAVPNSVAVANASPEVTARARWHIGACADDAVADALLDIVRAAETGSMPAFMS